MLRHTSTVLLCYKIWGYILYDSVEDCLIGPNDQKAAHDFHH
jgi:hypothetical protein